MHSGGKSLQRVLSARWKAGFCALILPVLLWSGGPTPALANTPASPTLHVADAASVHTQTQETSSTKSAPNRATADSSGAGSKNPSTTPATSTPPASSTKKASPPTKKSTAVRGPKTVQPAGRAAQDVKPQQSCAVPAAPGAVTATAGANQAAVTWTAADGSGSTITAYILSEQSGPNTGESVAVGPSATSAVLGGLVGGASAVLQVAAVSACGTGAQGVADAVTPTGATTTYAATVSASAPAAYYRLGDATGSLLSDSSGYGNDGTITAQGEPGGPSAIPGDPTTSLDSNTNISCCGPAAYASSDELPEYNAPRTVEAWIQTTQAGNNPIVLGYGSLNNYDQAFILSIDPDAIGIDGYGDYHLIQTTHTLNDGQWHYLAVTYDGTTVTAYLDGEEQGTTEFNSPLDTQPGSLDLTGGLYYNQYNGYLQDVAVYNQALSPQTIASHFQAAGYSVPGTPIYARTTTAGPNAAAVSWASVTAQNANVTSYTVTVASGPNTGESVAVPGDATSARLTGLAPGAMDVSVTPADTYGTATPIITNSYRVTGAPTTYNSTTLGFQPSVFYRLADSETAVMADSSANGATGTYVASNVTLGGPAALASDPATSLADQQRQQGIASSQPSSLPLYSSSRTVEIWLKTTWNNTEALLSYGQTNTDEGFTLLASPDSVSVDAWGDSHAMATPYPIDDGVWHMLAATFDGTNLEFYLDGVSLGSTTFNNPLNTLPGPFTLGSYTNGEYQLYSSSLADAAVFPSALSEANIATQFSASGYARPTAVSGLSATAGANQATVSWTTAAAAPGSSLEGYVVTAFAGGTAGPAMTVPASSISATLTGLAAGTAYTFSVMGVDSYGLGASAATTAAVTPTGSSSTYDSTTLGLNPTVFYRLADGSAAAMADSSPNQATGSYVASNVTVGAPPALPSDPATSVHDQYRQQGIGSSSAGSVLPLYAASRSIEVWENTTWNGYQGLASFGGSNTDQGFTLAMGPNSVEIDGYNDGHALTTPYPIDDGQWHMLAATFDGNSVSLYLDGVSLGTVTFNGTLDTLPGPFVLGSYPNGAWQLYSTSLADAAVFPSALSAADIASQFTASGYGRPTAASGLSATAGANQATVSWTTAATAAGVPLEGYVVTALNSSGAVAGPAVSVAASATSATLTGLTAGTAYGFSVVGVDSYGQGAAASTTTTVTPTGASSTYVSATLGLNPSVFYRLADGSTAAMADSSANGVTGSYVASNVTLGQPPALASDSASSVSDQYRQQGIGSASAGSVLPLYAASRSIEVWENTTWNGYQGLASFGQSNTDQGFTLAMGPNSVEIDGYNDGHAVNTPYPIDDGQWHMLAATFNGSTVSVYLDGVAIGTTHFNGPLDTLPGPFILGSYPNGGYQLYSTSLADAAVFPSALSGASIAAQFSASGYGRPTAVGGLSATAGANQATVSWTTPSTAPGNAVQGYIVTALSGTGPTAGPAVSVAASASSATITGLSAGTAYTFSVTGVGSYGQGAAATTPAAVTPTGTAATYASTTLGLKPSVFYRLADGSSAAMADSSPHQVTGEYVASNVTLGTAAALPSDPATSVSDQYRQQGIGSSAAGSVLPLYASARSVEIWVNTTWNGYRGLLSWGQANTDQGFTLAMGPNSIEVDSYSDGHAVATPYPIDDGQWHMLAATFNGSSVVIYLDGVAIGTTHFNGTQDTLPGNLVIGSYANGAYQVYSTSLADAAVFPSALSGASIAAQFSASGYGRPTAVSGLSATAGANQATVSWTTPATAPGSTVEGYIVTALSGTGPTAGPAVTVAASATSAVVTGLTAAVPYTFQVVAVDAYGAGAAADTSPAVSPTGNTTTYVSNLLSLGPSAFYRLADGGEGALADSSPHQVNGYYDTSVNTNNNAFGFGATGPLSGDPATAVQDNGYNIGTAYANLPDNNSSRTLEAWVQTTNGGFQCIAGWGGQSTSNGFDFCIAGTTIDVLGYNDDLDFTDPATVADGNWHFLAVTATGTSATVYVDGNSLGTQSFPTPIDTSLNTPLQVGSYIAGYYGIYGDLADVAVFPTALTADQISEQYTIGTTGSAGSMARKAPSPGPAQRVEPSAKASASTGTGATPPAKASPAKSPSAPASGPTTTPGSGPSTATTGASSPPVTPADEPAAPTAAGSRAG
jgi:hypothetical protein